MRSSEVGRSVECSSRKEAHVSRIGAWGWGLGLGGGGVQLEQEAKDRPHGALWTGDGGNKCALYLQWEPLEGSELGRAMV